MTVPSAELVLLVQTLALVSLSVLLVYPTVAYAPNVMHTWGIGLLATTLLVFTVSSIIAQFTPYEALAEAVHAAADLTLLGALYLFAREFVRVDDDPTDGVETHAVATDDDTDGGFERAED
ncbi:hypothetical protein Hbl1158_07075 [Halobaculum sp. CBA1158]|uniref:hypothetical protein n=1 Tax=Halobaculum sp. CBA1158 TaxID=2904243 RepID=UPI001F430FB2|nr:hypothetical protein [Halobaculum sp. CBA1158]UIP01101.1 hypothetical protein Hbl1158_07075 [Halobaculum sp. CBA1158]